MSMYGDSYYDKNNLYNEMLKFIENWGVSELLEVVADSVRNSKEE